MSLLFIPSPDSSHSLTLKARQKYCLRWLGLSSILLMLACILSLLIGSKAIPLKVVMDSLLNGNTHADSIIILQGRIPRTLLGLLAGAGLGTAGAIIQAVTRNPLADPGIFGVNAGAGFAVVVGIAFFSAVSIEDYIWFAFLGACITTIIVFLIGTLAAGKSSPIKLTLAGIAIGAVLSGIASGITLLSPEVFDRTRFWEAGTLDVRNIDMPTAIAPFIIIGCIIALWLSRSLNALSMGEDLAASLGSQIIGIQFWGLVSITLLCGGATAAAGPIAFIGLMVPHVARWIVGPDQRWIIPLSMVMAPTLLLSSDILGRIIVTGELRVSIVTAFIGAAVLIVLVRSKKSLSML
ncbi:Fe(3+)-siderophore ABC transporter permease [Gynuella sp.]|uniref:Fe(3+)-siderophore ABC transporter permease n=1 Tax=Gynuella sp. TaxID=2969146 RepID=UPI003D0C5B5C